MLKNEFLTVIIPVRGGSKGIPRKNLYKFGKDTLLERTIKIAILCDFVDKVIVSTEDQEMYDIAKNYSVSSKKLRDRKLATDQAKTIDVVISELEENKINNGFVLLLQVTSATRTLQDLNNFCKKFNNSENFDSAVSLVHFDSPHPDKIQTIQDGKVKSYLGKESMIARQSLPKVYALNGAFYVSHVKNILDKKSFFSENTLPFVMDYSKSFNLDNYSDLFTLEALIKNDIINIEEYDLVIE